MVSRLKLFALSSFQERCTPPIHHLHTHSLSTVNCRKFVMNFNTGFSSSSVIPNNQTQLGGGNGVDRKLHFVLTDTTVPLIRQARNFAVVTAITGLVEEVNRQIRSELLPENKVAQTQVDQTKLDDSSLTTAQEEESPRDDVEVELLHNTLEDDDPGKGSVKVLGMEMTESCEKGAKWSRPPTPLSRPSTPQNIYITGPLDPTSKLLVSDSHTETTSDDHSVVLTGKVTLSLIGLDKDESDAVECKSEIEAKPVECLSTGTNTSKHAIGRAKEKDEANMQKMRRDEDDSSAESEEFESDIEESTTPN